MKVDHSGFDGTLVRRKDSVRAKGDLAQVSVPEVGSKIDFVCEFQRDELCLWEERGMRFPTRSGNLTPQLSPDASPNPSQLFVFIMKWLLSDS